MQQKRYILLDSVSNKLFKFNENLQLEETVSTFKVNVNNFSDDQLKKMKSSQQYVIAREQALSIPKALEKVNLVYTATSAGKVKLDFTVDESIKDYQLVWTSSNEAVTKIVEYLEGEELVPYVDSFGLGNATISGDLYKSDDLDTPIASVKINVKVTATPEPDSEQPHYGFTIADLRNIGSFDLHLSGVTSVFRSVNTAHDQNLDLIYLADKANNQIVVVNSQTYEVVKVVTTPDDITFADKKFAPRKIITDTKGRMYVIAENVYEGIMQFSENGEFNRFTGVNYVSLTPWEIFWRNFSTEAQLSKQTSIINTSFTSLTVDNRGFIYTTAYAITNEDGLVTDDKNMIKKINQTGKDILRRNGYQEPMGDVTYFQGGTVAALRGPSKFVAIDVNEYGLYTVIDSKMGKLFTYDNEGRLLYISGEALYNDIDAPTEIDTLNEPVSIRYLGENLLVLDKNNKAIIIYESTEIGAVINEAAKLDFEGKSEEAAKVWEKVVKLNANYEYAYIGIGKDYLAKENYKEAMKYFELGADRDLYSKAYKLHRDGIIRKYFAPVMGGIFALIALRYGYKFINRKKYKKELDTGIGDE